jgi:transposase, IS6 family
LQEQVGLWVRLRQFRRPHCGSVRIDETYIKVRGQWRYLYRANDKHGEAVDFLLTANRDLDAAKRFFREILSAEPLLAPDRIGTDGAGPYPSAIAESRTEGRLPRTPIHYVTKHLQQSIASDHFRVKRAMPQVGGFRSFHTARRTICGFEAMLWLGKGFGFSGAWTVREQNQMLVYCFGLPQTNKASKRGGKRRSAAHNRVCDTPRALTCRGMRQAQAMGFELNPAAVAASGIDRGLPGGKGPPQPRGPLRIVRGPRPSAPG